MRISLIAAMDECGVIGRGGALPWHLPDDLNRFKRLTSGHVVIMGRRTFESLGGPLPRRRSIVVTRDREYRAEGAEVAGGLDEAIDRARDAGEREAFIIGGTSVFAEALPRADRLYLTVVHARVEGDVLFPACDLGEWTLIEQERHEADERHEHAFSFRTYARAG